MVAMSLVLAPLLLRGLKLAAKTPYAMRRWREKLAQAGVDESIFMDALVINPTPLPLRTHFKIITGNRLGAIGLVTGTIGFKHASGYEVILQLSDGETLFVPPMWLVPASVERTS